MTLQPQEFLLPSLSQEIHTHTQFSPPRSGAAAPAHGAAAPRQSDSACGMRLAQCSVSRVHCGSPGTAAAATHLQGPTMEYPSFRPQWLGFWFEGLHVQ